MASRLLTAAVALLLCSAARAGEQPVTFTRRPSAARVGNKVRIEFAASRETDVAGFGAISIGEKSYLPYMHHLRHYCFYPVDLFGPRLTQMDTNGNAVCHFGRYANRDAVGKDTDIPLGFGLAVAATDRYIYVGDIVNQCLVRVKLTYQAEETVLLP